MNTPEYLASQYGTSANLDARITLHSRFSTNPQGWTRWVFQHLALQPHMTILEVGCGTGLLWQAQNTEIPAGCAITLTDRSPGMLTQTRSNLDGCYPGFRFAVADAQALPFADESFDVVLANHMLYHVEDLPLTLMSLRRVLRPGGRFFASTNGEGHLAELHALVGRHDPRNPYGTHHVARRFGLENGAAILAPYFVELLCHVYPDALEITDAGALATYVGSMMPPGAEFTPERLAALERFLADEIARNGPIHVSKSSGMFEGRRS